MKTTIITRKIEIVPVYGYDENSTQEQIKEEKDKVWKKIRDIDYWSFRIANYTASKVWSTLSPYGNVRRGDLPKIEPYKIFSEDLCVKYPELRELKISAIASGITKEVSDKIKSEYYDYINGKKTIPSYKSGFPMYIPRARKKDEDSGNYVSIGMLTNPKNVDNIFTTPLGKFKLNFGRDRSNNKSIIDKCKTREYDLLDSTIQYDKRKNKLFLLAVIKIPVQGTALDESKYVGVDLGINCPITASVYGDDNLVNNHDKLYITDSIFIGSRDMFLVERLKMSKTRQSIQKSLKYTKGGHGRKRKLQFLDNLRIKEKNWVKTVNHKFSKELIDFTLKHNVKNIVLENLSGFNDTDKNKTFIGRYWSYFELQTMISNKAKKYDINVYFVDPKNTSKTCSVCDHLADDNRKSQSDFECTSCGSKFNADLNATRNIVKKHLNSLKC